jgi:cell division septation protein DedD
MMGIGGEREGGEQDDWGADEGEPLETDRLALDDEGERLPWLESSGDDEDYEESSGSGMLRLFLMGVVVLAILVGGIWWATNRGGGDAPVADGSTIAAPDTPYKEAPKDPGGKTFDGTGDSSFAVSEGQTRLPQLDPGQQAAPATPAPTPSSTAPAAKPSASGTVPAASGGVGVQVGAFSSKAAAEEGWSRLVSQSNGLLSGVSHRVIAGAADNGTIHRLQAVAPNADAARALCGKLKGAGIACQVK